jgi:hypothetical protein
MLVTSDNATDYDYNLCNLDYIINKIFMLNNLLFDNEYLPRVGLNIRNNYRLCNTVIKN